jgi:hypothetical protein
MMPMDFCASFEPCENAMSPAETSCSRASPVDAGGRTRRNDPVEGDHHPEGGEEAERGGDHERDEHLLAERRPLEGADARVGDDGAGEAADERVGGARRDARHQVTRFQMHAPRRAARTTGLRDDGDGSAKPEAMVFATAVPVTAPKN